MASGAGLIVAGLAVLLLGFLFFDFVVDSEEESRDSCDAANVGDEVGNETCDNKDKKFIGLQTLIYIIAVFAISLILIIGGAVRLSRN